jgi:hypothetical protein
MPWCVQRRIPSPAVRDSAVGVLRPLSTEGLSNVEWQCMCVHRAQPGQRKV